MNSNGKGIRKMEGNIRMSGFLEKKGKMKLLSQWKKYWFILEERLLLYYRSDVEYTNLSPCRGSLNMGLVTTVRPGSSSGPCIIHVITRSQVIQLRAKNRSIQEKWLEALLHSMSLPLMTSKLKSPVRKSNNTGYGSSLDNIVLKNTPFSQEFENDWTLPRKLDYRKRRISGTVYGGSLDTAIWSRNFKPSKAPSPSVTKGNFLEKILGFAKESDSLMTVRPRHSWLSLCEDKEMKFVGEDLEMCEKIFKCKVHDDNRSYDLKSTVIKKKKKIKKTLSDTELNKITDSHLSLESMKTESIKNTLSKITKDYILRGKPVAEKRNRSLKKKGQSFLQKVFKKKDCETRDFEPNFSEPLYDTIDHLQESTEDLIPSVLTEAENIVIEEEENPLKSVTGVESLYAEVQKPIVGSKIILPAMTMSELKLKLKSRGNFHTANRTGKAAPLLPPRRVSRPISPWHDVPTNNAPVSGNAKSFFVHQAMVKFNDSVPKIETSERESDICDIEKDLRLSPTAPKRESFDSSVQKKNDDLTMLLEQLTKITVAPFSEPEHNDDNYNSSSESEKFWSKSQLSEPDYDIPRSHRRLSIIISGGKEMISSTEFLGRCDNHSDAGSSFKSIEPDSLEMVEKNSESIF